ncbi:hypothetical protein ACH4YO_37900 [Streptomyces noursei]|uniref:hypothetical protein n=1 Tax=Streptomyces noursei TaxID=1971 RepID=UPI00081C7D29|nr:hypothetical protein SNOUR_00490 [Streptomyces noursei ATCC 11455]ANZ21914.1 hypothetical protein SNOUR_43460 [Streptomyces noursei ATCC 11455]MCZ0996509.1 hypothetical protein [Streptomyces noursei]
MMQHVCLRCQSHLTATHTQTSTTRIEALVTEPAEQEIESTCSRRLRREADFLQAVDWALSGGLHPQATDTTRRIARDMASRMHKSKHGHVAYGLAGMQQRLGLTRSTITKHVRILRELGLLAWVEHGSSTNVLRTRLGNRFTTGTGYRGTATIYAPCAPPAFDRDRGQLRGGRHGYHARIQAVTKTGHHQAAAAARRQRGTSRTPSCDVPPVVPAPTDSGGKNYSEPCRRASRPHQRAAGATSVTPHEAAAGITYAQQVRCLVGWTQGGCLRQLAYALRPLITAGLTSQEAARELSRWQPHGRPTNVVGYIRAELHRRGVRGVLHLPDAYLQPLHDTQADEEGQRHAQMVRDRWARCAPAYFRYLQTLAGPLRATLKRIRAELRQPSKPTTTWKPLLREREKDFFATLPPSGTPADIYAARARGQQPIHQPEEPTAAALTEWERRADEAAAKAAFQRLRAELAANAEASSRRHQSDG